MHTSSDNWSVECKPVGREGYVFYHESLGEIPFYWDYGGKPVVVIVRFEAPGQFNSRYAWAVERKREILERVAQELIRQQAPTCSAEIDEADLCIYLREFNPPKNGD